MRQIKRNIKELSWFGDKNQRRKLWKWKDGKIIKLKAGKMWGLKCKLTK